MTFDQLEVFEMIIEKGSFKAASEALHRTQPTLSIAIRKLEEEYAILLFSREAYRPKLTEEGKVFYTWAKQCLSSYRKLKTIGQELGLQKIEPHLTIVLDPLVQFSRMEAIFEECLVAGLPTELTLRSEILGHGMDLLLDEKADFAIAPMLTKHRDIESHSFDAIELLPCIAMSLRNAQGPMDIAWLESKTQVIVRSFVKGDGRREAIDIGILEKGKKCFVTDHTMKRNLILQGFGWGRLARHEIESESKAKLIILAGEELEPVMITLCLMRNKLKPMGPVAKAIWTRLKKSTSHDLRR